MLGLRDVGVYRILIAKKSRLLCDFYRAFVSRYNSHKPASINLSRFSPTKPRQNRDTLWALQEYREKSHFNRNNFRDKVG